MRTLGEYVNVYEFPMCGRLDCTSEEESLADAALIRTYIRAEKQFAASGRTPPSIAREVLTSVWEAPRSRFHREAQKRFTAKFRNKLLWVPWSVEAADLWNQTHSVDGLILEHVTPIVALWRKLRELDDEFEDPSSNFHADPEWGGSQHTWEGHAVSYLNNFWTVATLTREQASAIDSYAGLRTQGFEPNPFERYFQAEKLMNQDRQRGKVLPSFSTSRFILAS